MKHLSFQQYSLWLSIISFREGGKEFLKTQKSPSLPCLIPPTYLLYSQIMSKPSNRKQLEKA